MSDKNIPGTTIKESQMEKMLRHNREITGNASEHGDVDHNRVAEGLLASQPVLDPTVARPRVRQNGVTERVLRRQQEGVHGTSPNPGQDGDLGFIPPTTSNTADPGNIPAKGPDAETEPANKTRAEQIFDDISTLFAEDEDNPFPKKNKGKKGGEGDDEDGDGDSDRDDGGNDHEGDDEDDPEDDGEGDDKDKKDDVDEAVEVHCENCGYEETYELSESNIAEGNVPLTPEGKLNTACPMCGADMDLSMVGATPVQDISDPTPFTDPRGNDGPVRESVSPDALNYAAALTRRIVAGESVEDVAQFVVDGDFMPRSAA